MSSSLGLLGGYGSDSSDDSYNETITSITTINKEQKSLDITATTTAAPVSHLKIIVTSKDYDDEKKTTEPSFESPTANTTNKEQEKTRSFFDVDSEKEDESLTSSEEEKEEKNSPLNYSSHTKCPSTGSNLPLPQLGKIHCGLVKALPGSVFSNPYKEEEEMKRSVLEQHVNLAPPEIEKREERPKFSGRGGGKRRRGFTRDDKSDEFFDDKDSSIKSKKVFDRRKVGVAPGLVPSQKYMKLHEQQQAKERPWTLKR